MNPHMRSFFAALVFWLTILIGQATLDADDEQTTTQGEP